MYATKRRRRTVKTQKTPVKDPPKSNPSKRHRERLNSELDHLASLLPFEQSVISKLDKLSILRLAVSYLRTKSYFAAVLPDRYNLDSHHIIGRSHLFHEPGFSEGDSILQALYGFMVVITCDGEVFYASRTVEQYLGFHQSDIIHQSVMELIHSEDREEFKRQLSWNSTLPQDKSTMSLHELMMPENARYLHRSFTVRFRCLLDNTSGFITLEISGWIRVLHGQNVRTEEPQLALFATCCPFGPLSLMDIPSRELTFKSKHKMDFSPMSMDNRGKAMFGFADRELATKSGYDLIHPDDLNYFSSAHQELIKTGSSGLIAYRWCTKDFRWLWLQSSCKVIYKNSKPDFVICTHRQLTDDEGADLFHKRGNEFKLPYPLLDLDICSGFDFPNDEIVSKMKNVKNKKQKTCVRENYVQSPGRKRKCSREPVLNGYAGYPQYNGYDVADFKPDLLYPYPSAIEPDIYRGYASFHGSVYPGTESYRLADSEKHAYTNGYYLDPHRQYQHTLAYPGNGYSDLMAQPAKFGYDVTKYGFNSYDLDIAKKAHYGEDVGRYDNDYRKYAYEYGNDRLPTRLNGSIEPVDLRSSAMYNGVDGIVGHNPCLPPTSSLFKETKVICSPSDIGANQGMSSTMPLHHSSVIKNAASPRSMQSSRNSDHMGGGSPVNIYNNNNNNNNNNNSARVNVINNTASWHCTKPSQNIHPSPISTPRSDPGESPKLNCVNKNESSLLSTSSPVTGATPASVIHSAISNRTPSRIYDKQPMTGGIPVPVVKTSPWYQYPSSHAAYGDPKDWSIQDDMYSCHQKRGLISDNLSHLSKVTIT